MKVSLELKGMKEVEKEVMKIAGKTKEVRQEIAESSLKIQKKAKERLVDYKAVDTGHLRNSIIVEFAFNGDHAEIGPTAPYGPYVEYGTRPHFPPPDALEHWARHHGFESAWPICKIIAKRGLKARPYLMPSYEEVKDKFFENLKKVFMR